MSVSHVRAYRRVKHAFGIIDSFILTEKPPIGIFLESLSFLLKTPHQAALRDSQIENISDDLPVFNQDYREIRRKAIKFRVFTVAGRAPARVVEKLTYLSDVSIASSSFINGTLDFATLRKTIAEKNSFEEDNSEEDNSEEDSFDKNSSELIVLLDPIWYVLHSMGGDTDDFDLVAECLVLQRKIHSYWSALFQLDTL